MSTQPQQPATAGNFIALLQGKTGGVTLPQLDEELAQLVSAVRATGRKGTLTYKVTILPNAKQGVRIEDTVDIKEPKQERGVSFFWVGESGALLRNDPNQMVMALKVVPDATQEPLRVATQ
ncbi:MAG: hypothetical protein B9S38_02345 [Verrucomicrobiia bacterium Tous-C4TDCM]|nr:MAG: hypothetical protein B9S38_02345 [Verrucomicrobiae bacterium Tous-C4TDCM]